MNQRRTRAGSGAFLALLIGLLGFNNVSHRPEFAALRGVDVLQLIATGMCFGVALVALIALIRGKDTAAN